MVSKIDKLKSNSRNGDDKKRRLDLAALLEKKEQEKAGVFTNNERTPNKASEVIVDDSYTSMNVSVKTKEQIDEIVSLLKVSKVEFYKIISGYEGE